MVIGKRNMKERSCSIFECGILAEEVLARWPAVRSGLLQLRILHQALNTDFGMSI